MLLSQQHSREVSSRRICTGERTFCTGFQKGGLIMGQTKNTVTAEIPAVAISGLKQTVLRSKTDAMRSERT